MMELPEHKTKIVCTIGPSSRSGPVLEKLLRNGMNVARLNFAHGTLETHREDIRRIRSVAGSLHRPCMILSDLPGPKIRIGSLQNEPVVLGKDDRVVLTTKDVSGTSTRIPVNYEQLPKSVKPGSTIYLNDGFIQLQVENVSGSEVACKVVVGGELLSRKGLNIPDARLFLDAVTNRDLELVGFGLEEGVDAFGVSFVEKADDVLKVKEFAREKGKDARVVAKIERAEALQNIDEILDAADAIMIARGDLGVQIPLEDVPAVQKRLIHKANMKGCPVITATQMLVTMTENKRPTRAEVSDVANAILDGTDAVMLSEETAIGRYPVDAVIMISRIAASIERQRREIHALSDLVDYFKKDGDHENIAPGDIISRVAVETASALDTRYILVPTHSGFAPLHISRFKPECWIISFTDDEKTGNFLSLSYGVFPYLMENRMERPDAIIESIEKSGLIKRGDKMMLIGRNMDEIESIRIIDTGRT
jgi:pyruvate kinase